MPSKCQSISAINIIEHTGMPFEQRYACGAQRLHETLVHRIPVQDILVMYMYM